MSELEEIIETDASNVRELLSGSGYSDKAITYFLDKKNMGTLPDPDQVSELTGVCGDTMKVYLKMEEGKIKDAKIQVLGCPGAVASAMVAWIWSGERPLMKQNNFKTETSSGSWSRFRTRNSTAFV